jgi:glycoprotein-N-acetylgalactosamine 3-beta-galactosyltransferase
MKKYLQRLLILTVFITIASYVIYNYYLSNANGLLPRKILTEKQNGTTETGGAGRPRIFCMILTSKENLDGKARVIVKAWGHKCDAYKLISLIPDSLRLAGEESTGNMSLSGASQLNEIADILQPTGLIEDSYGKLTDKVFLTLKYLHKSYNDYDWYLKADDDTFIFVDNLRDFLADKNASQPVTYGYDFRVLVEKGYHSGGGGYVLSREALNRIGTVLSGNASQCSNTGIEDVDVARCLRKVGV